MGKDLRKGIWMPIQAGPRDAERTRQSNSSIVGSLKGDALCAPAEGAISGLMPGAQNIHEIDPKDGKDIALQNYQLP